MSNDNFKVSYDVKSKEFVFIHNFLKCRRCYVFDKEKLSPLEEESIIEGMQHLRFLSIFYPDRFELVFCPEVSSEDIPF